MQEEPMSLLDRIRIVGEKLSKIVNVEIEPISYLPPVTEGEVARFEREINFDLPSILRGFYLFEASGASFSWSTKSPDVFGRECSAGRLHLSSFPDVQDMYKEMVDMASEAEQDEAELSINEGLRALIEDWRNWLPFVTFPNGDAFCIDMKSHAVVFLEHDVTDGGPAIHGLKIAKNIDELFLLWEQVAFVDIYDWSKGTRDNGLELRSPIFTKLLAKLNP
jgi:hypothetical protein